ncbi:MAG: transcription-repair coupling factor [Candidatus Marinimicrobia bacterium]|nr:transcription-repair coupling factor [Candidatus Neomarinimicrobiota bacterium]MCF7829122.1 transcription-repair coupling factor [Candidatus Neomarinimicrobiota bacterium]MCF7881479.1 transcription-repair coupling factor [Candidatus Neomarinimicrobiota bacterium]
MADHLQTILAAVRRSETMRSLSADGGRISGIAGLSGSLTSFVAGELWKQKKSTFLIVAPEQRSAEYLRDDLSIVYGEEIVGYFPKGETHAKGRYFRATSDEFRVDSLEKVLRPEPAIIVAERDALTEPIISRGSFEQRTMEIQTGEEYPFEDLLRNLIDFGYSKESMVTQPLEISVRGGIMDVFPLGAENPYRLEFFGDELESIRSFSISSQRSIDKKSAVKIPPEISGEDPEPETQSYLWDYLPESAVVFWHYYDEITAESPDEDKTEPYVANLSRAFNHVYSYKVPPQGNQSVLNFRSNAQESMHGDLEVLQSQISNDLARGHSVYICCENAEQVYRLKKVLEPHEYQYIFSQEISQGFTYPDAGISVYTDHQIYSRFKPRRTFQKFAHEEIPKSVDHLSLGDYLVHQDYGIGIYRGLQKVQQRAGEYECIVIEYQDGDKVFVPLQKFHRVQKYQGTEGTSPTVHKLGTNRWEKQKSRTQQAVDEIADDLVDLYANRHSIEGYAFSEDDELQMQMESAFLYEETDDQIQATEEVKEDMESAFPMDRLLIGDVGFGKTEVAMRAIFKAVSDSKQVAVLVPTTILAEQHYSTFHERFQRFPIRTASLSRFRTKNEQKEILKNLKSGQLDIVIGTHRLLSKDVEFKDLGLIVVDEEHRFGVKHKENLKKMTERVDVLSMTATPIPRTLQLSLSGARDLSKIETPPKERLPIYTEIASFTDEFLREVIMREINRGGQVYFVHNRIQNINVIHKRLSTIMPDLKFAVGHGQMKGHQLEQVMVDFLHRKYDVLISTAIIESGIDMPNVNTIIINRADHMGLAQLYQLRGRVGRANRRAYAYLLVPSTQTMTEDARSRLQTLESFTHLGAGFQVAMKDLAMRGAGNLLGVKQSGFIDSIGFDLYMEMINKAIQEKQIERGMEPISSTETVDAEVNAAFDTYIPEDYVPEPDLRIDFYRRLSGAKSVEEVNEIAGEIEDRFGTPPEPVMNLVESMRVRCLCNQLGIKKLRIKEDRVAGSFMPDEQMQGIINYEEVVPTMLQLSENRFIPKFVPEDQLRFILKYRQYRNQLESIKYFLMQLLETVKFPESN